MCCGSRASISYLPARGYLANELSVQLPIRRLDAVTVTPAERMVPVAESPRYVAETALVCSSSPRRQVIV